MERIMLLMTIEPMNTIIVVLTGAMYVQKYLTSLEHR